MDHRVSVIDLGTNTFHLLSVQIVGPQEWITLDRERIFVNLASEGIEHISDDAMARGLAAMQRFKTRMTQHQVGQVIAVGTAALRNAGNAGVFLAMVNQATGIEVAVISGSREAELISKGVLYALPRLARPILIMDVGGGSVELIHAIGEKILFSESYPVGVAVMYAAFHAEEPISADSLHQMDRHLDITLDRLLEHLHQFPDTILVGASGTFEVVESILDSHRDPEIPPYSTAKPADFDGIYKEIISLDLEQRLQHPEIPESRARYIVAAVHLIQYMLRIVSQDIFYISAYALKEGLVVESSRFDV